MSNEEPAKNRLSITKDVAQLVVWIVTIGVALWGIHKGVTESNLHLQQQESDRRQREKDLRWQQAKLGRETVEKLLASPNTRSALRLLDWHEQEFETGLGQKIKIEQKELGNLLTSYGLRPEEKVIRNTFDDLFDGFELMEHSLQQKLMAFDDVALPLRYYVKKLAALNERTFENSSQRKCVISYYLKTYEFELASKFLERFKPQDWHECRAE